MGGAVTTPRGLREPHGPPMVVHDFPLRPDLVVRLTLPRHMTVADAERVTTFVYSLAFDDPEVTP